MTEDPRITAHRAQTQVAGTQVMTADEILAGQSQAGIPRPSFLNDHEDDGTVEHVSREAGDAS